MVYRKEDYIQTLADYIKRNLSKGYTTESLKWALISQGHSRTAAEKAIELTNKQLAAMAPKLPLQKEEKTEIVPEQKKEGFFRKLLKLFGKK